MKIIEIKPCLFCHGPMRMSRFSRHGNGKAPWAFYVTCQPCQYCAPTRDSGDAAIGEHNRVASLINPDDDLDLDQYQKQLIEGRYGSSEEVKAFRLHCQLSEMTQSRGWLAWTEIWNRFIKPGQITILPGSYLGDPGTECDANPYGPGRDKDGYFRRWGSL
jgi:hypothetical protein